ncbi:hypothetical protein PRZ48_011580 [Zasmidium cellare]|uniref:Zn(2)-C6 fungal-type domain-containing protein n=1 Tax=Zasmidium cellare TaxID=395010 RepID=A0ABR0E6Y6_ZASCE|nr:hypothetical protein PRZ48_011580 [Zasmidium cellare]
MASSSGESSHGSSSGTRTRGRQFASQQTDLVTAGESSKAKVTSACDACKRRKVKCTGTQPCDRCVASGVTCTFGSSAGRTSAVSYTRHLEEKIAELQALLRQRPMLESDRQREEVEESRENARGNLIDALTGPEDDHIFVSQADGATSFHGRLAGLSVLRTVRDLCTQVSGTTDMPFEFTGQALVESFDTNLLDVPSANRMATFALLPSRERLQKIVGIALNNVLNCKECLDRDVLKRQVTHLYDRDPDDYTQEDRRALGLIYALMALGRRHEPEDEDYEANHGTDMLVLKGVTYFRAARSIVDGCEVHDLNSIRTLIVMTSYLISSSMMSMAYGYICAGVTAAMRMGLHVSSTSLRNKFTPAELTERRQVFGVLTMMDTYISSILGMPNILRDADPDAIVPAPEEEMHDLGRAWSLANPLSPVSETLLNAKLFAIQAKILQEHYPPSKYAVNSNGKFSIPDGKIDAFAAELETWHADLPEMSPSNVVDDRALRSQLLLRFCFHSVQVSLYRPFLHHVARDRNDPTFNFKGYEFGSACIKACTQVVWLIDAIDRHGFLHEAQWFNTYHLAFAASSLMLFILSNRDGPTVEESQVAVVKAKELLGKQARRNIAARRCYESLARIPGTEAEVLGEGGSMSPRTRFMVGIGALDPLVERTGRP